MYHSFLIHLFADGHLGCFHVLAVVYNAVMNIGIHVSLSTLVSLVCMPSSGIKLNFKRIQTNMACRSDCMTVNFPLFSSEMKVTRPYFSSPSRTFLSII